MVSNEDRIVASPFERSLSMSLFDFIIQLIFAILDLVFFFV